MSTTEQGTHFELLVYKLVQELLAKEDFLIAGKFWEIFHQKGYYSAARQGDIFVDLSVEFRRTSESNPFLYVLIECKDYKSSVPVSDLEEFYAKTQQISGVNAKAILFTRSSLQAGAFNFAQSKGMAVVRILDDDSLQWLIERTNRNLVTSQTSSIGINVINALTNEYFVSTRRNTFAFINGKAFYNLDEVFKELITDD